MLGDERWLIGPVGGYIDEQTYVAKKKEENKRLCPRIARSDVSYRGDDSRVARRTKDIPQDPTNSIEDLIIECRFDADFEER